MKNRFPFLSAAVIVLILVAVTLPGRIIQQLPGNYFGVDKLVHMLMFMCLAVVLHADFGIFTKRDFIAAFLLGLAFSFLTEAVQLFIEGRSFDLADGMADLSGFAFGIFTRKWLSSPIGKMKAKLNASHVDKEE